jgi:hypothetical protein
VVETAPKRPLFYNFTSKITGNVIGAITEVKNLEADSFYIYSPAAPQGTEAILNVSFNQKDW